MPINPLQLLKRLEPAVRPVASGRVAAARPPFEARGFDQMLALVSDGRVSSGRKVTVAFEADPPLNEAQLDRLGAAADLAESSGASSAMMLIDGRGITLDVNERTLTDELTPTSSVVNTVDAAVYVIDPERDHPSEPLRPGMGIWGAGIMPPGAARHFGFPEDRPDGTTA